VYVGGAISLIPIALAITRPGAASTRYAIATAQMAMSSLLVRFTGGRIEAHFHLFGSLAFLSLYRDWRIFIPATLVVVSDHFVRGVYAPPSVLWMAFEEVFLIAACLRSRLEMRDSAARAAAASTARSVIAPSWIAPKGSSWPMP